MLQDTADLTQPAFDASKLARIASLAGAVIMDIYDSGELGEDRKADGSSVTRADEAAEALILKELAALAPDIPVIAEESVAAGHLPEHGETFYLVDPLDGTREFINRNGEFTVNIALIHQGRPVAGVVYAPACRRLFVAERPDHGWQAELSPGDDVPEERQRLSIRACPERGPMAVASRSHRDPATDQILTRYGVAETVSAGSSLKFCLVAAGEADLYPRTGRTMEWDTAAGQAVAEAAGARVLDLDTGKPLLYGKRERGYDNPGFIVLGDISAR